MKASTIRCLLAHRPFRPFVLRLSNGDSHRIGTPAAFACGYGVPRRSVLRTRRREILLTDAELVALDADGEFVWVDTDSIVTIKPVRRRNGHAR